MRTDEFDDLARRFADGRLSRRGVLKVVLLGILSAGQAWFGLRRANAYAPGAMQQAADFTVYLPLVRSSCTKASRCGSRVLCDEKQGCLCVETTEGDIRCGKLPSCNVKLCLSSADCASLGEGAFCDTPLSGCCTSPPNTLSRCLLPCPPCPEERLCNTNCCAEGQVCRAGQCVSPNFCEADPITEESMAAARAAYLAGASDIALSPNGCQRYKRVEGSGLVKRETITFGDFAVFRADHLLNNTVDSYYDNDQDGFNELNTLIAYQSGTNRLANRTFRRYDPATKKLISRRAENRRDDTTVNVTAEEWDTTGVLISSQTFVDSLLTIFPEGDTTIHRADILAPFTTPIVTQAPGTAMTCAGDQNDLLQQRMSEALAAGAACLKKYKHPSTTHFDLFRLGATINFVCDPTLDAKAQATSGDFPKGPVTITVNWNNFNSSQGLLPGESLAQLQARVMFHEIVHFMLGDPGDHSPRTENYSQFDPTRACERLCFDPNANQCHCQTCLGGQQCADQCKSLPACSSSIQECGNRCCVGPCEGKACCPSKRICNKKPGETATCCAANEVCLNLTGGGSSCCPANQVCKAAGASDGAEGKEICCQPNDTCGTDAAGNPKCITPQIFCPACPAQGRPIQCFPANQAAACQSACSASLACPTSCQPANNNQCP